MEYIMTTDTDFIKMHYRIEDIADRLGMTPTTCSSNMQLYHCPFHSPDNDPSFAIYLNSQRGSCFTPGCPWHGSWNDAIHLVMDNQGVSFLDAVNWIRGGDRSAPILYRKPVQQEKPDLWVSVAEGLKNRNRAIQEWQRRGLPQETVSRFSIGAVYDSMKSKYKLIDGTLVSRMKTWWFTIPWYRGKHIYGIKTRLDIPFAREVLSMTDINLIRRVTEDIASRKGIHPIEVEEGDLFSVFFGSNRYGSIGGSSFVGRIYNSAVLIREQPIINYPKHEVVAVTEGEINAQTMNLYGIPSTAMKSVPTAAEAFKNVRLIWGIQDNDPEKNGIAAGEVYAKSWIKNTGRTPDVDIVISVPPSPYKDINDLHQAGIAQDWINSEKKRIGIA